MRSLYRSQFTRTDSGLRDVVYSTDTILESNPAVHRHTADKRHIRILLAILESQKGLDLRQRAVFRTQSLASLSRGMF